MGTLNQIQIGKSKGKFFFEKEKEYSYAFTGIDNKIKIPVLKTYTASATVSEEQALKIMEENQEYF